MTWLAACALVGACYVDTPKHDVADAEAIREAAKLDAAGDERDAGRVDSASTEDTSVGDAGAGDTGLVDCDCDTKGEAPVCLADGTCVACDADSGTCSEDTPLCDVATHTCKACLGHADCTTAAAPVCSDGVCTACVANADCAHIPGQNVCADGQCVACTSKQDEACGMGATATACNPKTLACTTRVKGSTSTCQACVSDAECEAGDVCVDVPAGGGGSVCLPTVPEVGTCQRPYVGGSPEPVLSAEGKLVPVCTLSVAGATCKAQADYTARRRCGLPVEGHPEQDVIGSGQSTVCGVTGLDDGYCVYSSQLKQYLCTVACKPASGSDNALDCPPLASSCASSTYAGSTTPRTLCSL